MGRKTSEIVSSLKNAQDEPAVSSRSVQQWIESFKAARTKAEGWPTSCLMTQVEALLQENARMTLRHYHSFSCHQRRFRARQHDSTRWVPRLLTPAMGIRAKIARRLVAGNSSSIHPLNKGVKVSENLFSSATCAFLQSHA